MRKAVMVFLCVLMAGAWSVFSGQTGHAQENVLIVYDEGNEDAAEGFVASGWMGDYGTVQVAQQYDQNPHSGTYCQQWTYFSYVPMGQGWTGVYWQHPEKNWGEKPGLNLKKFTRLSFWARGETGREVVTFLVGGIRGTYSDSAKVELTKVALSKAWKQYSINLSRENLSNIIGGFGWVASRQDNPQGCVFYLDDIRYE